MKEDNIKLDKILKQLKKNVPKIENEEEIADAVFFQLERKKRVQKYHFWKIMINTAAIFLLILVLNEVFYFRSTSAEFKTITSLQSYYKNSNCSKYETAKSSSVFEEFGCVNAQSRLRKERITQIIETYETDTIEIIIKHAK